MGETGGWNRECRDNLEVILELSRNRRMFKVIVVFFVFIVIELGKGNVSSTRSFVFCTLVLFGFGKV